MWQVAHGACVRSRQLFPPVSSRQRLSSSVPRKMALTLEITVGLGAHKACAVTAVCEIEECVESHGLTLLLALISVRDLSRTTALSPQTERTRSLAEVTLQTV